MKNPAIFPRAEDETPNVSLDSNQDFTFILQKALLSALAQRRLLTPEQMEEAMKKLTLRQKGAKPK